jgi:hypothetical protein
MAQQWQTSIRAKTNRAARSAIRGTNTIGNITEHVELLLREIAVADVALTILKAEHKAIVERIEQLNSNSIPLLILVQSDPELVSFSDQKEALWQQKNELKLDDPRGVEILQQIKELEDKISKIAADTDSDEINRLQDRLRTQEEMNLYSLGGKIRAKEILMQTLTERYNEQLAKQTERAEDILDVSFEQVQLARTSKILDQIEERILAISSEQRAPGQITLLSRAVSGSSSSRKTRCCE